MRRRLLAVTLALFVALTGSALVGGNEPTETVVADGGGHEITVGANRGW